MITANIVHRVLRVAWKENAATAFTIEVDNKQYLITVKHLFSESEKDDWQNVDLTQISTLGIFYSEGLKEIAVRPVIIKNPNIDIAIFATDELLSPTYEAEPTSCDMVYGQDVFFLGFPFQISWGSGKQNHGKSFPLVRKGILSSIPCQDVPNGLFYIDAMNNPGFSGSPIIFKPSNSSVFRIAGVIHGYLPEEIPLYDEGKPTKFSIPTNTALTIGYAIDDAVKAIKENPIGCPITS
jgi:hypothetical protein